jgi:hypothetical protein
MCLFKIRKSGARLLLVLAVALTYLRTVRAEPVINENVANSGVITIYPDRQDPHRYYIAPNVVTIATDEKGTPYFSYVDVRTALFSKGGIMQMTLMAAYTREDLEVAKAGVLKKDPLAQFSGVPFMSSTLQLTGDLPILISENKCDHPAGLIGQEEACVLQLTSKGREVFFKSIAKKTLFTTLQLDYTIGAAVRKANGGFDNQEAHFGVAVRIDGALLAKHPELIQKDLLQEIE